MRLPFRRRGSSRRRPLISPPSIASLLAIAVLAPQSASSISFTPAPQPNLDLSQLGRVALAGDFNGISLFQFEEQNENPFSTNGSESLLARMPNGAFAQIVKTDATIRTMCAFINQGAMAGVVIGGNFTSLGSMQSTAIALFNPNTSQITPLSGLSGEVNSILCDPPSNTVYVGGSFVGANSTNAIAWVGTEGWTNLPFAGFNGPVTSITKASNGHIIFGGGFTGLGNASTPSKPDGQVINLSTATITSGSSTAAQGFSNPSNIVCKTGGADGSGNTWLLADQTPGFWQASFGFGFRPTKLRLWNTHQDGRGTKTWRFTAMPINGIMNLTYIDPATGNNASCTSECPLSSDKSVQFQDFHFVNVIGMNAFRIDISDWYGNGGGLDGVELFENDIYAYAVKDFNEPACANVPFASTATTTGPWTVTPSHDSTSQYLTAQLSAPITNTSASIVFSPDIKESGRYTISVYTPGCQPDNTCSTRGQVVFSGQMTARGGVNETIDPSKTLLYQTNNFDKYDQIYSGMIDASSDSFRPQVTMTPAPGQSLTTMTLVAQKVGFVLINSTGGLNGLFEYDPTQAVVNVADFDKSVFDKTGAAFTAGSAVNALASEGDITYVGGNFSSDAAKNILAINSKTSTTQALDGGLNGEVLSLYLNGNTLFVGGSFSGTQDNTVKGLSNVAAYDTTKNSWSPLGAGVNGRVRKVVPLTMNITSTTPEVVISVTGDFQELNAFGSNPAVPADGFGVWVPSQDNWLRNLQLPVASISGILSSAILSVPGGDALYGGSVSSSALGSTGAVTVDNSLGRLPINIQPSTPSSGLSKRESLFNSSLSGVITGTFDLNNNRNITILGGHFTAKATNGSTISNLLFINATNNSTVSGLGPEVSEDSTFVALAVQGDNLFAGGNVTGTINNADVRGLVSYNLATNTYNPQPPALSGGDTTVSAIALRPSSADFYVGGSFRSAGSLQCPAVCIFSTTSGQWNPPGQNLDGSVTSLLWASDSKLIAGGNLTVNGTKSTNLAVYDPTKTTWDSYPGASELPGPVDVVTAASSDGNQIWAAGTSTSNGSVYLMKYDGSKWISAGEILLPGTNIRGLQVLSLTTSHESTPIVDADQALLLTGSIGLPGFGSASAVLYNGTTLQPYALTTNSGNTAGSLSHMFSEHQNFFSSKKHHLALGFVVLIGLAVSLGLILLLVLAGLFLDRLRKRREGYMPAPTSMYDRGSGMARIPPEQLFGDVGRGAAQRPHI